MKNHALRIAVRRAIRKIKGERQKEDGVEAVLVFFNDANALNHDLLAENDLGVVKETIRRRLQ